MRADRLGVTGFCGGSALTLHFTAEYRGVTAAVPWYGHVKRAYQDAPGVDAFAIASILYPGAPHAFFSDDRPQVSKKDGAEDAGKPCLAFFGRHLKAD